jgi:hypothetical protein
LIRRTDVDNAGEGSSAFSHGKSHLLYPSCRAKYRAQIERPSLDRQRVGVPHLTLVLRQKRALSQEAFAVPVQGLIWTDLSGQLSRDHNLKLASFRGSGAVSILERPHSKGRRGRIFIPN